MVALILTDKITSLSPARSATLKTERFQTDNYSIRAAKGFNNAEVSYQLSWIKLTQVEAKSLGDLFDATLGVSLVQWTPPYENVEQNFTVSQYNVQLLDDSTATASEYFYTVSATLLKEYDLV